MNGRLYVAVSDALGPGARLAQCAHAVAELHAVAPGVCAAWRGTSNTVVIVAAPPERLAELADFEGAAAFREPDLGDELTAVAILPRDARALRALRRLPLAA